MKFTDIPKMTRTPTYHINVGLDYLDTYIAGSIRDSNLQLNPDFQRGHVWTEEQQISYVEYLLKGGASSKDIYLNHHGWFRDFKGDFVCVDGLQRITACLKFINNAIKAFGYYHKDYEDRVRMANVNLSIYINDLETKKEVLKWYVEMNSGGTVHTESEIQRVVDMINEEG